MVISPCMIKTQLSALCLGFGRAGTVAAWMPVLRAVASSVAHVTPAGSSQEPPALMWDFPGEAEVQNYWKHLSAPKWYRWGGKEGVQAAGGCVFHLTNCSAASVLLPIFTPEMGTAGMRKDFAQSPCFTFYFPYLGKKGNPSHPRNPTFKDNWMLIKYTHHLSSSFPHPALWGWILLTLG